MDFIEQGAYENVAGMYEADRPSAREAVNDDVCSKGGWPKSSFYRAPKIVEDPLLQVRRSF